MRDERRNYIVVGIFVLGLLAALIVWIVALSGFLGRTDPYFIVYRNVTGLGPGTEVLYEGYRVGVIEGIDTIERDGQQRFRVDVSVRRGWRIPADSAAVIGAPGFLSAFVIDIDAGTSAQAVPPGGEIEGRELVNVVESASRTVDRINEFVESVRPTVESINLQVPAVLQNVESLTVDVNDTVGRVNEMLGPEARDRLHRILINVDEATAEAASFASELRESRRQVDATLRRVDELIARNEPGVDQGLEDLQDSLESVSRRIDAMTYNLEATTRNMSEFSREIRSNPGLILRGREAGEEPAGGGG